MVIKLGVIQNLSVTFVYDEAFDQLHLQLLDSNDEVVEPLVSEGDPHYRVNAHFKGDVDDWLAQEFIPECNQALESYFGKDAAPDMGAIAERIQWNLKNNTSLDGNQIVYTKP